MDFNVKRFVGEAGTAISRLVQVSVGRKHGPSPSPSQCLITLYIFITQFRVVSKLTEEKLGTSERTELDSHFETLLERSDSTRMWTEKLLKNSEAVLTPNPGDSYILSVSIYLAFVCTWAD